MKVNYLFDKISSYLIVLTVFLLGSCSNELFEEPQVSNETDRMIENNSDLEMVVRSREFKMYNSEYTKLTSIIREAALRMSREERADYQELAQLYLTDPQKYGSLMTYQFGVMLGTDTIEAKKVFFSLLEAKKDLMGNKKLVEAIEGNEELVFAELEANKLMNETNSVPIVKTRSEGDKLKFCLDICWEEYQRKLRSLKDTYFCATFINIATCIATSGSTVVLNSIEQMLLFSAYETGKLDAYDVYEICRKRCLLDWG